MPNPCVVQGSVVLISYPLPPWEHWPEGLETHVQVPATLSKSLLLPHPGLQDVQDHAIWWEKLSWNSHAYKVLEGWGQLDNFNGPL